MRRWSLLALAGVVVGCAEADRTLGPDEGPAFAIGDARVEGGNPHFFWLPPIGPAVPHGGTVAEGISPEVHICTLEGEACGEEVALFTMEGTGSGAIRVDDTGASYIVDWHTNQLHEGVGPLAGTVYRILVLAEGQELGFADVITAQGRDRAGVDQTAFVVISPGQTLPIRFRIEDGALEAGPEDAGFVRTSIATAPFHTCALAADGGAHCWGAGWWGQLGTGAFGESLSPTPVTGEHAFVAIAAGMFHTCGLDDQGAAWCWGSNTSGALGTGTLGGSETAPAAVTGAPPFVQIAAGGEFTCGRTAEGALFCWGSGLVGQLGNASTTNSAVPVAVSGGHTFIDFDAGNEHVCAIDDAGAAWCWGGNLWGQLGNGSTAPAFPFIGSTEPVQVLGSMTFTRITAGGNHSCALDAASSAFCWGGGFDGQLGNGGNVSTTAPVAVNGAIAFVRIDAGTSHTCATAADGSGWCWGSNSFGQTGTGTPGNPLRVLEPAPILGGFAFARIHGSDVHTCAVTTDGTGLCWGSANLGNGSTDPLAQPGPIAGALQLAVN